MTMNLHRRPLWSFYALLLVMLLATSTAGQSLPSLLPLITNGGYLLKAEQKQWHYQSEAEFVPASTIKLVTALIALRTLGADHRFTTTFYYDEQQRLYVSGSGDPLLTSEVITGIARDLYAKGIRQIHELILDETAFALAEPRPDGSEDSARPYDAPNGALAVNFNSISLRVDDQGQLHSDEPQTPLLPLGKEIGKSLTKGRHRINLGSLRLAGPLPPTSRYTAELLTELFRQVGITTGPARLGAPPAGLPATFIHHSPLPLSEVVRQCLEHSNNFIANQLFLACGASQFGAPATWEKSQRYFSETLNHLLSKGEIISMIEGSGLSRQNRANALGLARILEELSPHASLLPQQKEGLLKTGTLRGVYCYAGYIHVGDELAPLVILLNQPDNNRKQVLEAMLHELRR